MVRVCLYVYVSVCYSISNRLFDFVDDLDHDLDLGIVQYTRLRVSWDQLHVSECF